MIAAQKKRGQDVVASGPSNQSQVALTTKESELKIAVTKDDDNSVPQAQPGNSWLVWDRKPFEPTEFDDYGSVVRRGEQASFRTLSLQHSHFSPLGLGCYSLRIGGGNGTTTADVLLGSVSGTADLGSINYLDNRTAAEIVRAAPVAANKSMKEVEAGILALATLSNQTRSTFSARDRLPDKRFVVIAGEEYGTAYVPSGIADGFVKLDGGEESLRFTHQFVDLLETKHQLFKALGLDAYIERDNKCIANGLESAERSRR